DKSKPPTSKAPRRPRRFEIVVVDPEGKGRTLFRPVTVPGSDEPPRDLHFLTDDRLVYEVVPPAIPPSAPVPSGKRSPKHAPRGKPAAHVAAPAAAAHAALPQRLFVT